MTVVTETEDDFLYLERTLLTKDGVTESLTCGMNDRGTSCSESLVDHEEVL